MSQFPDVTSIYGAPMGRSNHPIPSDAPPKSIRLYRVRINSGGYDDGGAYWGIGQRLYCAESILDDYQEFIRADSRDHVVQRLKLNPSQLIRK